MPEAAGPRPHQGPRRHVRRDDQDDVPRRAEEARPAPVEGAARCSTRTRRRRRRPGPAASSPSTRRTAPSACCAPAAAPTGASTSRATRTRRRPAARAASPAQRQRARPLRHRLRALHVLRHLRRGVPVRRPVLEPEYEYSEPRIADLLHDKDRLGEWMETVPDFEPYEAGSRGQGQEGPESDGDRLARRRWSAQNIAFGVIAAVMVVGALRVVTTKNVVHAALYLVRRARRRRRQLPAARRRVRRRHPGPRLHRRHRRAVPVRHHAHPGAARREPRPRPTTQLVGRARRRRSVLLGVLALHADRRLRRRRAPAPRSPCRRTAAGAATRSSRLPRPVRGRSSLLLLAALIGAIVLARKE